MSYFDARKTVNKCNNECPLLAYQLTSNFIPFEFEYNFNLISALYSEKMIKIINKIFVGEAGGKHEEKYKIPFYKFASSGKILRQIIIDLNLMNWGIANIVCCRPFVNIPKIKNNKVYYKKSNRTPNQEECEYCIDHLKVFLNCISNNSRIVLLGKTATFSVLGKINNYVKDYTITQLNKLKPIKIGKHIYGATFHPRYIHQFGGIKSKKYEEYKKRIKYILETEDYIIC